MYYKVKIKKMPKARTGYQVQGSLFNDVPAFGGADYNSYIGTPNLKESKYITAVPRDKANLEAEGGETVFGDINGDGLPEHKIIKGPRHSEGGVPLNLPDDSFIFSDTKSMKIKDPNILAMFNKPIKKSGYTPAELAKSYDLEKYRKILQDPNSDHIDRKTAELMLRNYNVKLAQLALAQEAKKGFPQGIAKVAQPAMQAMGLKEENILPVDLPAPMPQQNQMAEEGEENELEGQEMAEEMNQGQPVAMPMSEEQMQGQQEQMMAYGGIPMAEYGMMMGGYDMPFDLPEAEYGMPMGVTSRNYMGREPMYARGGISYDDAHDLYTMGGGGEPPNSKVVKRSDYGTDEAGEKAYQRALRLGTIDAQKTGKKLYIQDADGKYKPVSMKYADVEYKGDLAQFGNDKESANRYAAIEAAFQDPDAVKIFAKHTRDALKDKKSYTRKTGDVAKSYGFINPGTGRTGYLGDIDKISDEDIVNAFKEHNQRNLMLQGHGYYASLYNDSDGKLRRKTSTGNGEGDNKGFIETMMEMKKPDGTNYTKAEAEAKYAHMSNPSNKVNTLDATFKTIGAPAMVANTSGTAHNKKALLQQASFHGYDRMVKASKDGTLTPDEMASIMDFRGNLQAGYYDEVGTGAGALSRISPIDADYTNTTAGQQGDAARVTFEFGDEYIDEGCQCEDSAKPNYKPKDADGNCTCEEIPPPKKPKTCECTKEDGTKVPSYIDEATGECSEVPCQELVPPPDVPAPWWLQDTIKTTALAGDLMSLKKYMPWAPDARLVKPRPTFLDPTRELAAQSEQANIQTQGMAQFAGPQALSSRASSVQGQAAKQAADTLSRYNNANVNIANQYEMKRTDIDNQELGMRQAQQQKLYDQNTIANQQFDNSKRAVRNALVNQYTNAITNRWQTHALNQMYPQFNVDPSIGGRGFFTGVNKKITPGSGAKDYYTYRDECVQKGASDPDACAKNAMNAASSGGTSDPNLAAYNAHYGKKKKGGSNEHPGFLYGDVTYPFIL